MLLSVNPDVAPPWIANVSPKPTSAANGLSPSFVSAVNTRPLVIRFSNSSTFDLSALASNAAASALPFKPSSTAPTRSFVLCNWSPVIASVEPFAMLPAAILDNFVGAPVVEPFGPTKRASGVATG